MTRTHGILIVDRGWLTRLVTRSNRQPPPEPALPFAPLEVCRRYQGFEGQPWPRSERHFEVVDGLVDAADLSVVEEYLSAEPAGEWSMLYIARPGADVAAIEQSGWRWHGHDVGFFHSEWSHFSVIVHEVLFGVQPELRVFASRTNPYLLIDDLEEARRVVTEHDRLGAQGRDVETIAPVEPILVFSRAIPRLAPRSSQQEARDRG